MSKAVASIIKMPDNVKVSSISVQTIEPNGEGLVKFGTITTTFSVGWALTAGSVAGYVWLPVESPLYNIPIVLSILGGITAMWHIVSYFGDGIPNRIPKHLRRRRADNSSRLEGNGYTIHDGVQIQSWSRSPFMGNIHFLLPLRMFRKIKMHESISYFPHEDKYVKRTEYLTFSRWIEYKEIFDGHRAVFQKAIDSF